MPDIQGLHRAIFNYSSRLNLMNILQPPSCYNKSIAVAIVGCVSTYYQFSQAEDLTLFIWSSKEGANVYFNWKINNEGVPVYGASGDFIIEEILLSPPLGLIKTTQQLSSVLNETLEGAHGLDDPLLLKYMSGLNFNKENWKDILEKAIGISYVKEYHSTLLYQAISDKLRPKSGSRAAQNKV